MKRIYTILIFMIVFPLASCGQKQQDQIITIDSSAYIDYPAVWFSPSTGEIVAFEDGTSPAAEYEFWVEPRDPEFAILDESGDSGAYGILFIGTGSEIFKNTTSIVEDGYDSGEYSLEENGVYLIHTETGDCVIHIIKLSSHDNYMRFWWKSLE